MVNPDDFQPPDWAPKKNSWRMSDFLWIPFLMSLGGLAAFLMWLKYR